MLWSLHSEGPLPLDILASNALLYAAARHATVVTARDVFHGSQAAIDLWPQYSSEIERLPMATPVDDFSFRQKLKSLREKAKLPSSLSSNLRSLFELVDLNDS